MTNLQSAKAHLELLIAIRDDYAKKKKQRRSFPWYMRILKAILRGPTLWEIDIELDREISLQLMYTEHYLKRHYISSGGTWSENHTIDTRIFIEVSGASFKFDLAGGKI